MRNGLTIGVGLVVAAAAPALASEEGGGAQALLTPHIGTVFWTLLTFVLFAWLLSRLAWKPMLGALKHREDSIRDSIEQARADQAEAKKLLDEHKQLLAESHRQRAEALEQGRRDAETLKAELMAQANQQRDQLLKQTEAQVQAELRQARSELRDQVADLAIRAAEKLLAKNLDGDAQRRLVEDHLADLERLN